MKKIKQFFKRIFYFIKYLSIIDPETEIGKNTRIGPFTKIRGKVIIGNNVKIGSFVEIKNSCIGDWTKIPHFSYIGDAKIGKNVNIGAGVVTCNFDGFSKQKHKTIIKNGAFIGSGAKLIAPLKIGKNAYIAAGSVIVKNVPDNALAIARVSQVNKLNWVVERKEKEKRYRESIKNLSNPSVECPRCKDKIPWNTKNKLIYCSCGYIQVKGDGFHINITKKSENKTSS